MNPMHSFPLFWLLVAIILGGYGLAKSIRESKRRRQVLELRRRLAAQLWASQAIRRVR